MSSMITSIALCCLPHNITFIVYWWKVYALSSHPHLLENPFVRQQGISNRVSFRGQQQGQVQGVRNSVKVNNRVRVRVVGQVGFLTSDVYVAFILVQFFSFNLDFFKDAFIIVYYTNFHLFLILKKRAYLSFLIQFIYLFINTVYNKYCQNISAIRSKQDPCMHTHKHILFQIDI